MKKQILTDRAEKAYLQKLFECTNVMVWKALELILSQNLIKPQTTDNQVQITT